MTARRNFALAGLATLALAGPAIAADIGGAPAAIVETATVGGYNWNGFYVGGHLGAGHLASEYTYLTTPLPIPIDALAGQGFSRSVGGFLGGIQLGYNWQMSRVAVLGIEGSASFATTSSNFLAPASVTVWGAPDRFRVANNFLGNVSVRAGLSIDRALLFGKVGMAVGTFSFRQADPGASIHASASATRVGLLLGAGVEYAIAPNWTIGAEYNLNYFGPFSRTTSGTTTPFSYRTDASVHVGKITLNYLFSTGATAIAARY